MHRASETPASSLGGSPSCTPGNEGSEFAVGSPPMGHAWRPVRLPEHASRGLFLAGATLSLLAGCSSPATTERSPASIQPVSAAEARRAVDAVATSPDLHATITMAVTQRGIPSGSGHGSAEVDLTTREAEVTLDVSHVASLPGISALTFVTTSGVSYLSTPSMAIATHGKSWAQLATPRGAPAGAACLLSLMADEPANAVAQIAHDSAALASLGGRVVDGIPTTGFSGMVAQSQSSGRGICMASGALRFSLFVNASGRLRRLVVTLADEGAPSGSGVTLREVCDPATTGPAVSVSAPPRSAIIPLGDFLAALRRG